MSGPSGLTTYKKQEGVLSISKDRRSVEWAPTSGTTDGKPSVVLNIANVTNLQQTPATSAKVMLKIFYQITGQAEAVPYVFTFISPANPRGEADTIKSALSVAIQALKSAETGPPAATNGSSAAMAIASAVSARGGPGKNLWDDDNSLKSDTDLQQSLFKTDPALQRTFMESLRTKPEAISSLQFADQFWSTRIHLLRAHAIEKSQTRGSYNVLSALKPATTLLNISREQVQLIFNQHPLVKRVYDREVPKPLNEGDFWSRFFQSRLLKKLRGEKIDPTDPTDKYLDKYLNEEEFAGHSRAYDATIPRIIDLEGNEENHSQRRGNAPEISLRPRSLDKVPIIRSLNNLSEKIMAQVAPSDIDPSQPIGMDETTYNNLRLRDLQGDSEQTRLILKVRDQSHFFSETGKGADAVDVFAKIRAKPEKPIKAVNAGLTSRFPNPGAGVLVSSEDHDQDVDKRNDKGKAGSHEASRAATAHILALLRQHRLQTEPIPDSLGLPTHIYDRLKLTHATTTEFLHQFWSAFTSGRPERAGEIASLVDSLSRAVERVQAVADDAEQEKKNQIKDAERQALEREKRTGRKSRVDYAKIGGGSKVVEHLLEPTTHAISVALGKYKQALAEQSGEGVKEDGQ